MTGQKLPPHGPPPGRVYKAPASHTDFLRTYSARIYFIGTNSSLACLHMPHPSNPVDDNRVRPSYRAHGPALRARGREDVWLTSSVVPISVAREVRQRVGRQSDGLPQGCSLLCSLSNIHDFLPITLLWCDERTIAPPNVL